MDYNSIHGPGISNFSSPSPHRMPTVSAAQAFQNLKSSPTRCVSTSLSNLDAALQNRESPLPSAEPLLGGISRGKVTEIYGPPGVGKTALSMQIAASVLYSGEGVVWVDASHPISGSRFTQILNSYQSNRQSTSSSPPKDISSLLSNLTHFLTPTLAHLLTLIINSTSSHPPPNTSLIVIDSLSTLISNAFPRNTTSTPNTKKPGQPNPSSRKFPILQTLITALQKLALTRNLVVVLLSQCVTKMRPGAGAVMVPAINTTAWEQGLSCRVCIFRDWGWDDEDGNPVNDVRLVKVLKAEGVVAAEGRERIVGFSILADGLKQLILPVTSTRISPPQIPVAEKSTSGAEGSLKRKFEATDLEIPDSDEDDEDYGWGEEDEQELPPPPPQWQGSEDILVIREEEELEEDAELDELAEGIKGDNSGVGGESGLSGLKETGKRIRREVVEDSEDELAYD